MKDKNAVADWIKQKMFGGGMADQTAKKVAERPNKVQEEVDKAMGVTPKRK